MTENQKLREALQAFEKRGTGFDSCPTRRLPQSDEAKQIDQWWLRYFMDADLSVRSLARQALAMPTAPAISDTWGISRSLVTLYAYECDGATDKALALITADHIPDAGKMIETAAPVGEREAFEHDLSKSPFEFDMDRWPDNAPVDWPGSYKQYHVQCAWDAWKARAALSAGDAVDAQRYRWLMDNCTLGIKQNGVGWSLNTTACIAPDCIKDVGATIDAAMRKGQL